MHKFRYKRLQLLCNVPFRGNLQKRPKTTLGISYTPGGPHGVPSKLTIEYQDCIKTFTGGEITETKVAELDLITVDLSKKEPGTPRVGVPLQK